MPTNTNVGLKIKELRKAHNMRQSELADKLGISNKTISSWESGRTEPALDMIKKVCDIFGVTYNVLLDGSWSNYIQDIQNSDFGYYLDPKTAKKAQELFDDPNLRVLFDAARDAKPEDLQKAADYLKAAKAMTLGLDNDEGC